MIFLGIAWLNGETAPVGTGIVAHDGDREIGSALVNEGGEVFLEVRQSQGPITFKVGCFDAQETVPEWRIGNITVGFNLTAGGG